MGVGWCIDTQADVGSKTTYDFSNRENARRILKNNVCVCTARQFISQSPVVPANPYVVVQGHYAVHMSTKLCNAVTGLFRKTRPLLNESSRAGIVSACEACQLCHMVCMGFGYFFIHVRAGLSESCTCSSLSLG